MFLQIFIQQEYWEDLGISKDLYLAIKILGGYLTKHVVAWQLLITCLCSRTECYLDDSDSWYRIIPRLCAIKTFSPTGWSMEENPGIIHFIYTILKIHYTLNGAKSLCFYLDILCKHHTVQINSQIWKWKKFSQIQVTWKINRSSFFRKGTF